MNGRWIWKSITSEKQFEQGCDLEQVYDLG